ncbi:MAG: NIPSNAP family protein [Planctomycetes bacterium]|nr:NIPSNAP family protein [Planctomycetota bacterium]
MTRSIERRNFLKSSAALAAVCAISPTASAARSGGKKPDGPKQEFYELRVWKIETAEKQKIVLKYIEKALLPALNRLDIDRVGVFTQIETEATPDGGSDLSVYCLIPYQTFMAFGRINARLKMDKKYQAAAAEYFGTAKKDPVYTRIESKFFKAFAGMPVIEMPSQTAKKKPRIFEMRTYESHNEQKAALKVQMFNAGEIQAMREAGIAPVFFGEALIGHDIPNLTYMLSGDNYESLMKEWEDFKVHPTWQRLKSMDKYKDTVSNITKIFLSPTRFSQI